MGADPLVRWRKGLTPQTFLDAGYAGVRLPIGGPHYFAEVAIYDLDAIHIVQTVDMSGRSRERSWLPGGKRRYGGRAYKFPSKRKPWVSPHMEQLREDLYAAGVPRSTDIGIEAYPPGHDLEGFKVEIRD